MVKTTVRFRLDFADVAAVCPGKIDLLEHIQSTGSLSQAGRELGMSYRRAWLLLDSLNSSFREPVVSTSIGGKAGGGAWLTEVDSKSKNENLEDLMMIGNRGYLARTEDDLCDVFDRALAVSRFLLESADGWLG